MEIFIGGDLNKKLITEAVKTVNNLSKDIGGNLLSGQEMRVVEYLQIQRSILDALEDKLAAAGDFKAEQSLEKALKAVSGKMDAMTPFNPAIAAESLQSWDERGVSLPSLVDRQQA
ncbi:hypothetical protein GTP46_11245 [Duganella sp. FT135W]|uniref:Uncharacterized protein n=1 Tax=Duganella flavida TaxID=2692175 RepID=A0A6L8KFI1_9BURK|nr:hypothetical protein [Duganella flavida]MYM23221.1 hypothetical protein [Duganella flavida]